MTTEPKKRRDPPLRLDMGFDEALERLAQTDPAELPNAPDATAKVAQGKRRMDKDRKKFEFQLYFDEAAHIMGAAGSGGHQSLHRRLVDELESNNNTVTFDDCQLGELIRHMTLYKSGGLQSRLRKAFRRSIRDLFDNADA